MLSYTAKTFRIQNPTSKLVGFGDLIIDGKMVVRGFKIFESEKGLFVSAPSKKDPNGKIDEKTGKEVWYPDVTFIDEKESEKDLLTPFQKEVYDVILEEFKNNKAPTTKKDASTPATGTKKTGPLKNPWQS